MAQDTDNIAQDLAKIDAEWIASKVRIKLRHRTTVAELALKAGVSEKAVTTLVDSPTHVTLGDALAMLNALGWELSMKPDPKAGR